MSLSITKTKFDSLSKPEQDLIKKLGVTISTSEGGACLSSSPGKPIVQSYVTLVETSCKLCKSITTTAFSMEGVGTTLHSRQIALSEITPDTRVTTRNERTNVCPHCRKQLSLLSQAELIEMSINIMKGVH